MLLVVTKFILLGCLLCRNVSSAFQLGPRFLNPLPSSDSLVTKEGIGDRRGFLGKIALVGSVLVASPIFPAKAEEDKDNLAATLYNPDGSLRTDIEVEAKFRTVEFPWDLSDELLLNIDGVNSGSTPKGSKVKLTYELPEKWEAGNGQDGLYLDKSPGVNARALERITVYQAPGNVPIEQLEKATKIGIAKALKVTDDMKAVASADVVGGRTQIRNGQKYFDFDLAVAPASCDGKAKDNLGLGFCPYDSVVIMSATSLDDKLYVIVMQCDKLEWKRSNSDLKRVRSSFQVERV
jgi:hypothetical protein